MVSDLQGVAGSQMQLGASWQVGYGMSCEGKGRQGRPATPPVLARMPGHDACRACAWQSGAAGVSSTTEGSAQGTLKSPSPGTLPCW